jgi:hypothetical protein
VYAVRATIGSEGRPIFTTTAVVKVITWDRPDRVDLVLTRAADARAADAAAPTPAPHLP